MPEYNFQLRGWHALLALAALLAYFAITVALRVRPVDEEMRAAVRERLLDEYSGRGPKDVARIVEEARQGAPIENIPNVVQRDIQFPSIGAHGQMGRGVVYVRAEIMVDGGAPPDGRSLRYFRITRKYGGGWRVDGESTSSVYYNELWR